MEPVVRDDEDETVREKEVDRGASTECVTLRRIEPIRLGGAAAREPQSSHATDVDRRSASEITDPERHGFSDERRSVPAVRSSEIDLVTTLELPPRPATTKPINELRASAPELEAMLAPPTFDVPAPPVIGVGAHTQLSLTPRTKSRSLPTLPRGTVVGDYEVDRKIGDGAMGEVYGAVHRTIGRRVAIKVISTRLFDDPDAEARFVREARAVAAIHHPGIVDVFGFGTLDDGRMYLIMEWLHGRSLAARLREGPLDITAACDVILQITSALRAAHEQGIVHRDLKPDNVFLQEIEDEKPIVKILDFGLAARTGEPTLSHTRTGQLLGTPLYISPEQARGKEVEPSTDIYSLGCIAYQLFTGRPPFIADNVADLVASHLNEQPPEPRSIVSDLPAALAALLLGMTEKAPARRPSLAEVRRAIQGVVGVSSARMAAVADPTAKEPDAKLPLAAPAPSSPPDVLESDVEELETQEMPDRRVIAEAIAGDQPALHAATEQARSSRAFVIALWVILVVSIAILIWFGTH